MRLGASARMCIFVYASAQSADLVRTSPAIRRVIAVPHAPPHVASILSFNNVAAWVARTIVISGFVMVISLLIKITRNDNDNVDNDDDDDVVKE